MKIYVSAPSENREDLEVFFKAVKKLTSDGHKILDVYSDNKSEKDDVDSLVKKYKESESALRNCDVYLVDVTYPGRRVGFEIARALDEKKFIIAIYNKRKEQSAKRIAPLIVENNKHAFFEGYTDETINDVLKTGLEQARNKVDTKFILIISPEIDRYLEWSSNEKRMHKAQIVRNAIEEVITKDKEYQKHLKDLDLL